MNLRKPIIIGAAFTIGCIASWGFLASEYSGTPSENPSKAFKDVIIYEEYPEVVASPIVPVIIESFLEEPFPWENVEGALLDCDKERQSERIALACNIYHEARGETLKGQVAVALVTRNRVKSERYPDTYSEVVWQIKRSKKTKRKVAQFSWALDGKHDRIYDVQAWRTAWEIAADIIAGNYEDFTNGSLWYHAKKVKPEWRKKFQVEAVIGEHIFYRK